MRFWDSSVVVPLVVEEPASAGCRKLLRGDHRMVVWCLTPIEVLSGLCRRERDGSLDREAFRAAVDRLKKLERFWSEIEEVVAVRDEAERLLRVHPLRAADAAQLGAALIATDHRPRRHALVTLDDLLARAADAEGFEVIRPGR